MHAGWYRPRCRAWPRSSSSPYDCTVGPEVQVVSTARAGTLVNSTLAAVILLAPLLILPGLSFYFDVTPKVAVVMLGTSLALLSSCLPGPLGHARGPARATQPRPSGSAPWAGPLKVRSEEH